MSKQNWIVLAAGVLVGGVGCATDHSQTVTNNPVTTPSGQRAVTRYNSNGNEQYTGTKDAMYTRKGDSIRVDAATHKACGNLPESHFAFDSATLKGSTSAGLDSLATCLTSGALKGQAFFLTGHTDPRGGPEYNQELGKERANSVASYLETKGVEAKRITVVSAGATDATGTDEASWAQDRVVDVTVRR